jgi:hypothetical protein
LVKVPSPVTRTRSKLANEQASVALIERISKERISSISEEEQSSWEWLFGASPRNEQKEKVLQYVVHRLKVGRRWMV